MAYSSSSFFCSESFVGWRIISPFGEVAGFLPFFFRYLTDMMSLPFGEASTDASMLYSRLSSNRATCDASSSSNCFMKSGVTFTTSAPSDSIVDGPPGVVKGDSGEGKSLMYMLNLCDHRDAKSGQFDERQAVKTSV